MPPTPPRSPSPLRRARQARGWSQRQVAEAVGTNGFTVARWELGLAVPSPHFRQQLSALFALPLETLGILPAQAPTSAAESPLDSAELAPAPALCLLPPRPRYFLGRKEALQTVLHALEASSPGQVYAISGLPGIGKSALAAEVVHHLSRDPDWAARFPDGIISLSGQGHQGEAGLMALLTDLLLSFAALPAPLASRSLQELVRQTRATLSDKRALLLLDDLDPAFPLAQARRVLLAHHMHPQHGLVGCTLLITSRLVPPPGLVEGHLALLPLEPDAAMELLTLLVGSSFSPEEQADAYHFVALVGYVPLGIEWGAHALSLGLSAAMLVTHFRQFTSAREDEGGLYARFVQAVAALPADLQARLARLAPLGTRPFHVEEATLMHLPEATWKAEQPGAAPGQFHTPPEAWPRQTDAEQDLPSTGTAAPVLAATAADLLRLAEHSLLLPAHPASNRFRMPPLLQAVAADLERQQYAEALALAEQYPIQLPEALQPQVLAALAHAWYSRNHSHVLELAYSLYWNTSRLPAWQGQRVLQWGLAASQALHDCYYLVRFLSRLGKLRLFQGDFAMAEALEEEATTLARPLFRQAASARVPRLLIPWVHRTLIAGFQEELEETERRVWPLLRQSEDVGSPEEVAAAYMKLAFYHRLAGKLDQAARMLEIAATLAHGQSWNPYPLAELALEQARQAGDDQQIAMALKHLLEDVVDPQVQADVLCDQAHYLLRRGQRGEAMVYGMQSLHLAQHTGAPLLVKRSRDLLLRLSL